jgi:Kef-type K+ transport system membrane component KefB
MAAKGEVTLIFATTAYSLGYFTDTLFAAVISLVMIDSLVIPTLLKIGIEKWITDDS